MKRAVPNSPNSNPKPTKTNVARPNPSTAQKKASTKDLQAPTPDTSVEIIENLDGNNASEAEGDHTNASANEDTRQSTVTKIRATRGRVATSFKARPVIIDKYTGKDDDDWVDDEEGTGEKADSDAEPEPKATRKGKQAVANVHPKRGRPSKGTARKNEQAKKPQPVFLQLAAFRDLSDLSDVLLNKIAKILKLWIVTSRTKEASRKAKSEAYDARCRFLTAKATYEAGLTPLGLVIYQKAQLEDSMTRRFEKEDGKARVEKECSELRLKLMQMERPEMR